MKKEVKKKRKELSSICKEYYGFKIKIKIKYNLTSKRAIGIYYYGSKEYIRLNKSLLIEHGHKYINNVFTHEFAHAVVKRLYPTGYFKNNRVYPHGKEFQSVCRLFGINGTATTNISKW